MVVFYSIYQNGHRGYSVISPWLSNVIFNDIDISYWAIPGTLED